MIQYSNAIRISGEFTFEGLDEYMNIFVLNSFSISHMFAYCRQVNGVINCNPRSLDSQFDDVPIAHGSFDFKSLCPA
jgi:hypothetical protein